MSSESTTVLDVCRQSAGFLLATVCIFWLVKYISKLYTLSEIPGPPSSSWLLGHGPERQRAPVGTVYNTWSSEYGHTYKLKGPFGTAELILGDPRGANYILNSLNYVRPSSDRKILEQFVGGGLFTAEGEEHKQQRSILNTAFTSASVRDVSDVIYDLVHKMASTWEEDLDSEPALEKTIEMTNVIHRAALDAISMTAFAFDISHSDQAISTLLSQLSDIPQNTTTLLVDAFVDLFPSLTKLPSPMKAWSKMLRTEFGKIADAVWLQENGAGMHSKLLDSMRNSHVVTGKPMDRDLAIAQIAGVLIAGHETSANIIVECLYELSRNMDVQTKLRNELLEFSRSRSGQEPGHDDLTNGSDLLYLDAVTRETMRTKAAIMVVTREAVSRDVIHLDFPIRNSGSKQVVVEAGQIVHVPIRDGINTDVTLWGADATVFRPERWIGKHALPDEVKKIHAPGYLMTFGDGPKICLGRHFAVAEFKIMISILVRRFIFEPDGQEYTFYRSGNNTVKPTMRGQEQNGHKLFLRVRRVPDEHRV